MGKIERLDTSRNVECFPRTLNRQNPDKAYFIDSQRNTSAFKRLFSTPKAINAKVFPQYVGDMDEGVAFENSKQFSMTLASKTISEGHQVLEYACTGAVDTFTEEQVQAWGATAVAGETTFCVIAYQTGLPGATQRKVGWIAAANAAFESDATVRDLDPTGINSTVLGLTGPGTVSNGRKFYRADVLDKSGKVLCTYVWDLSSLMGGEIMSKAKAKKIVIESATREPVKSTTALSEAERLIQELK